MDASKTYVNSKRVRPVDERAAPGAARAEVVEIFAGAILTLLIEGRMSVSRDLDTCRSKTANEG